MTFEAPVDEEVGATGDEFTMEVRNWWLGRRVKFTIRGYKAFFPQIFELCRSKIKWGKKRWSGYRDTST